MNYPILQLFAFIFCLFLVSSCSITSHESAQTASENVIPTTVNERNKQLKRLLSWKVSGKIAFIKEDERNSANFVWNKKNKTEQEINLTTYLGINVLELTSENNFHQLTIGGETYHGDNLDNLIYQLTQLNFPTQALTYWLKALPFSSKDQITYQENNYLPQTLTSHYNQQTWLINYNAYKTINGYQLPTNLTIKTFNLIIKIRINQWTI